jgi:SAM-dependent methyltransferase
VTPSSWVRRWSRLLPSAAEVLDVACGSGRHLRWLAAQGFRVTGVDRDAAALAGLQGRGELLAADIESGPWPLAGRSFDAIVVTNYLWRPLWPTLLASLRPGGLLVYETFADGQQTLGKPSNPQFLLQPGELLAAVAGRLRVLGYEDGFLDAPPRFIQRIAAVQERSAAAPPPRYDLNPPGRD